MGVTMVSGCIPDTGHANVSGKRPLGVLFGASLDVSLDVSLDAVFDASLDAVFDASLDAPLNVSLDAPFNAWLWFVEII